MEVFKVGENHKKIYSLHKISCEHIAHHSAIFIYDFAALLHLQKTLLLKDISAQSSEQSRMIRKLHPAGDERPYWA